MTATGGTTSRSACARAAEADRHDYRTVAAHGGRRRDVRPLLRAGSASLCVHWLLLELGVVFEARRLDLDAGSTQSGIPEAAIPTAVVPTLLIDGTARLRSGGADCRCWPSAIAKRRCRRPSDGRAHDLPAVDVSPVEHAAAGIPHLVLSGRARPARETLDAAPIVAEVVARGSRRRGSAIAVAPVVRRSP